MLGSRDAGRRPSARPRSAAIRHDQPAEAGQLALRRRAPAGSERPLARPAPGAVDRAGRPLVLLSVMALLFGLLVARLAFWAVIEHGRLAAAAAAEHANLQVQQPLRGVIYDAEGDPLAMDVTMNLVYAVPKEIKKPAQTAALVAPILGLPQKYLEGIFTSDASYAQLAPRVSESVSKKLQDLALPGIALYPVVQRTYPEKSTAAQVLGYARLDDSKGFYGLEGYYDGWLSGQAGLRSVLRDTAGDDIRISPAPQSPAHNGAELHLSIDRLVQQLAEDDLQKAVRQHQADGGTIIVIDPRTGFILGMASTPSYDPNNYARVADQDPALFQNPAIQSVYEPGSTFKIITMAAGLDSHVITPQSAFDDTGQFVVGDRTIHNWNMQGFGWENMIQVLQHSANVGASWVAQRLGTSLFYKYVQRFQFGRPTGVDLQGEGQGILPLPGDKTWTTVNLFTNSFGQGISVTPLQMIRAVAAVANGGVLMKPQIVKRIVYDGRIIDRQPVSEGRVVAPQTARTLTDMLLHSAIDGEASEALIKGYNIAAKTGTANIAGPDGQYIPDATIASIVGYAPAFHPRFAALVIINHPRDTIWGSMAAAPVMHDLFQELFMHYHIPPSPHALFR
ncbi:MAG: penicillin-binding protein 2 [Chloroflexi bacterium]|nr:penicillin-binding protein 2 [Chloroflexota bacterium]